MYKNDKPVKNILFDVKLTEATQWFASHQLTTNSWDDLQSGYFSNTGSIFKARLHFNEFFVIAKKESKKCELNEGWLKVLEHGKRCTSFAIQKTSGIYYSTTKNAALWSNGTNGPLKRQKNWAWTSWKCCTDRIILPVYRDKNLLRVEKKVGQGPSCARFRLHNTFENRTNKTGY